MFIDDLDLKIIKELYKLKKNENINYFRMVSRIFNTLSEYEKRKKYCNVRNKMDKLVNYGIIKRIEKGKKEVIEIIFELQMQNVHFRRMKFNDKLCSAVCLKIENIWCAFQLQ